MAKHTGVYTIQICIHVHVHVTYTCMFFYSKTGDYLLTGTGNGCVRVYQLSSPYTLTSLEKHWTLSYHDNHYGQVKTMSLSYDGKYLVSGGADGNMFVYKTDLPTVSKYSRSDVKSTESAQVR